MPRLGDEGNCGRHSSGLLSGRAPDQIKAHIVIAFLACCLHALRRRLHASAPAVQLIDVHLPTTGGRELLLTRYTQPEPELQLLVQQPRFQLPPQAPPKMTTAAVAHATVAKTFRSISSINDEQIRSESGNPRRRASEPETLPILPANRSGGVCIPQRRLRC
jgi:hypothetical protein